MGMHRSLYNGLAHHLDPSKQLALPHLDEWVQSSWLSPSQGGRFEVESVGGMKFRKRENPEKNPKNPGVAHLQYPSGVVRIRT
ncbi:hypothetical protein C0J52_17722 [Blattella germanica]|nr:hypothetical protein C0J52_17722 [Blattella germanica]